MLSTIVLQSVQQLGRIKIDETTHPAAQPVLKTPKLSGTTSDYFNNGRPQRVQIPPWTDSQSSVHVQGNNPLSASTSSRGSWSSLFNAPMRQLISNVQDATEGFLTPVEASSNLSPDDPVSIPVPIRGRGARTVGSPGARLPQQRTSSFSSPSFHSVPVSRSWQESSIKMTRAPSTKSVAKETLKKRKVVVFHQDTESRIL